MKKILDEEAIRRQECTKAYNNARRKVWDLVQEDFKIDENFNFTHVTWKGVYAMGGNTIIATVEIINRYIDECKKPYGQRDLSFIHLVKD